MNKNNYNKKKTRFISFEMFFLCGWSLFLLFIIPLYSSAETIRNFPLCSSGNCIKTPVDLVISNDGEFLLILDSFAQPSLVKSTVSSDNIGNFTSIPLGEDVSNNNFLKIEISKDNKKALVTSSALEQNISLNQVFAEGTGCNCPLGYYFDETICIFGMLTCDSTQDTVCGCNNKNYLNSCVARSNGIKKYTKAICGTTSNLSCSLDSDCPLGSCPNGGTFKKFTCTNFICMLTEFSKEPCSSVVSSSSSSGSMLTEDSCKCKTGSYFNSSNCIEGTLSCEGESSDTVCGCDNNNYLNSCAVHANGVKKFTKGACNTSSNLTCNDDSQCPSGKCLNGQAFNQFSCINSMCNLIQYSVDPCPTSSSGSTSGEDNFSTVKIVDLTDKSVKTFIPLIKGKSQVITASAFADSEGKKILAGNNDESMTTFFILDAETGEITNNFSGPGIAKSIEFSPDYNQALITFSGSLSQSVAFYNARTKAIKKLDTPNKIFFDIDEFLSNADFDLKSKKAILSSLGGKHVTHIADLKNQRMTINFYGNNLKGKTISAISPDGLIAVSAGEVSEKEELVIYKLNISQIRKPSLLKTVSFKNEGSILDIAITPDNNRILLLLLKEGEKRIKALKLNDLSLLCDYKISSGTLSKFLNIDPLGRYIAFINNNSIDIVNDIRLAPVLKNISISENNLTIDGFVDPERFDKNISVCLQGKRMCAKSITISEDGRTVSGELPKTSNKGNQSITITGEDKLTIQDPIQCGNEVKSFYSMILN